MFGSLKKRWVMAAVAASMALAPMGAMTASAYFTAYVSASGTKTVTLGTSVELKEQVNGLTKAITASNSGDSECYVRVKIFMGDSFTPDISGDGWEKGSGGYWYYSSALQPGGTSGPLYVKISTPDGFADDFNVAVAQESTPVQYMDNGSPYADWEIASVDGEVP